MSKAIVVMLLLAAVPVLGNQSSPAAASSPRVGALRPAESDPSKRLFKLQKRVQPSIEAPLPKPKVVCGMTIVTADPKIDPRMLIPPPADGVKYRIRAIEPPICNPTR